MTEAENRRAEEDRRNAEDRRRSAKGLFELRARRDRVTSDRRQTERRAESRFRLAFWRRRDA
ncbi:MAG: hypothetical protein GKR90_18865 [Pseudomonadales bacterium]|nr:hypothetical protein [Pseudomonadales bacterium]